MNICKMLSYNQKKKYYLYKFFQTIFYMMLICIIYTKDKYSCTWNYISYNVQYENERKINAICSIMKNIIQLANLYQTTYYYIPLNFLNITNHDVTLEMNKT